MKTSLKWIKDLVPGLEVSPQTFADAMTLSGSKVEYYDCMDADRLLAWRRMEFYDVGSVLRHLAFAGKIFSCFEN